MSGVEGVVTEVLREHTWINSNYGRTCMCRFKRSVAADEHAAHVAAAVVQALGLTEELKYPTSWMHPHPGPERRWVSPWVAVERGEQ